MALPQLTIGMLPIVSFSRSEWAEHLIREAQRPRVPGHEPRVFSSANGHVLSRAASDPRFRALLQAMDGIDADGMPLVFASRALSGRALPERCATTDLFHDVAARAEREGLSMYCLGADERANSGAVDQIHRFYPRLRIVGRHHGYMEESETPGIVASIDAAAPDILWIGLGVPREQEFALRYRGALTHVGVVKTCGGLFDFLSGARPRAPELMQQIGCEWLFRLVQEPRRLFRRYALTNIHATWLLLTGTLIPDDHPWGTADVPGRLSWLDGEPLSF